MVQIPLFLKFSSWTKLCHDVMLYQFYLVCSVLFQVYRFCSFFFWGEFYDYKSLNTFFPTIVSFFFKYTNIFRMNCLCPPCLAYCLHSFYFSCFSYIFTLFILRCSFIPLIFIPYHPLLDLGYLSVINGEGLGAFEVCFYCSASPFPCHVLYHLVFVLLLYQSDILIQLFYSTQRESVSVSWVLFHL